MITDPVREVESDLGKKIVLCTVANTGEPCTMFVSWVVYRTMGSPLDVDGVRLEVSSPSGERYAY